MTYVQRLRVEDADVRPARCQLVDSQWAPRLREASPLLTIPPLLWLQELLFARGGALAF
jgi:hypothetical protein